MVHNRYRQRGGEDVVFEAECDLLERNGHNVHRLTFDNASIPDSSSYMSALRLARTSVWSKESATRLYEQARRSQSSVVHFHNTFPLVSPSGYYAVRKIGVRVVQTLHNYRLICPSAELYRSGKPCRDCVGRPLPWPGVWHKCYHDSRGQTAVVAAMNFAHRLYGTWNNAIDQYIALTEFSRRQFVNGGLPEDKLVVKPNFLDPAPAQKTSLGEHFLFAGRLTETKGVNTLLEAWGSNSISIPLRIAGSGPLTPKVLGISKIKPMVDYLGPINGSDVIKEMSNARALVFPSTWYEGFPMTLIEAFACGLPVIAARHGAMEEVIEDGRTGILFTPNDANDLASKSRWAWNHPEILRRMGAAARAEFELKYTGAQNYEQLLNIYGWD